MQHRDPVLVTKHQHISLFSKACSLEGGSKGGSEGGREGVREGGSEGGRE